jgi:hypothetical protein
MNQTNAYAIETSELNYMFSHGRKVVNNVSLKVPKEVSSDSWVRMAPVKQLLYDCLPVCLKMIVTIFLFTANH